MKQPKVSIVVLTYNAPKYVYRTLRSLYTTVYGNYEVIVFDNNSRLITKLVNLYALKRGWIDRLIFSPKNILFSPGNNEAVKSIAADSEYVLLLNSDVQIRHSEWLDKLMSIHEYGATALGVCKNEPQRADGYCFLTDRKLYEKYKLDEEFEWWWGLTKYQAEILNKEVCNVKAVIAHEDLLIHFGGASRKGFWNVKDLNNAKGLEQSVIEVKSWFNRKSVEIIDRLS
ncbi:hypothetical protein GCM10027051_01000 [Niabella terrae]